MSQQVPGKNLHPSIVMQQSKECRWKSTDDENPMPHCDAAGDAGRLPRQMHQFPAPTPQGFTPGKIHPGRSGGLCLLQSGSPRNQPMGMVIRMDSTTLSNQITRISLIFNGISVPIMQGMLAEKNRISEMLTTAMTNFNSRVPLLLIRMEGRNISGRHRAAALPPKAAWEMPNSLKRCIHDFRQVNCTGFVSLAIWMLEKRIISPQSPLPGPAAVPASPGLHPGPGSLFRLLFH